MPCLRWLPIPIFTTVQGPLEIINTRKDLIAFYADRGLLSPFRSKATLPYRRAFLWSMPTAAVLIGASFVWQSVAWFFMFGALILLGGVLVLLYATGHVLHTRRVVHRWAAQHGDGKPIHLWLGLEGYRLVDSNSERLVRWSAVQRANIEKDHVLILVDVERIFLRKSMREADFQVLCDTVRERVPNAVTVSDRPC